jgi:hypothetical protein
MFHAHVALVKVSVANAANEEIQREVPYGIKLLVMKRVSYPVVLCPSTKDDHGYGKTIPTVRRRPSAGGAWGGNPTGTSCD